MKRRNSTNKTDLNRKRKVKANKTTYSFWISYSCINLDLTFGKYSMKPQKWCISQKSMFLRFFLNIL
jgi:hypothetical protein